MKRLTFLFLMLAFSFSGIHAQESAFEVLLPYHIDMSESFCCETADGHYLVIPGSECKIAKISQYGKVVDEMAYVMDSVNNPWTWFGGLLDIPGDPSHHIVIAECYDEATDSHNKFHIVKIDDNLQYDPDEVIAVDLSEEVQHFWNKTPARYVLEDDGSLSFAATVIKWDGTYGVMYARISPEGEKTVVFDNQFGFDSSNFQMCDFAWHNDHYNMVAGFNYNHRIFVGFYEVSREFESDSVFGFTGSSVTSPLVYDNLGDSVCVANWGGRTAIVPVWLDDNTFLLPTSIAGMSHFSMQLSSGVGLWKMDAEFNVLDRAFIDVYDNNTLNVEELYAWNPLLVNGDDVYLCYMAFKGTHSSPMRTVICKFDTDLNLKWKRWYGRPNGKDIVTGTALTSDGGCLVSGEVFKQGGSEFLYVLKITPDGYCAVQENDEPLLKPYCFFPNPVDDRLHMEFSPDVTPKQVELYDLQGRLVSIQNNGFEGVEMGQLPSGFYTMRIIMEDGANYSEKVVKQ